MRLLTSAPAGGIIHSWPESRPLEMGEYTSAMDNMASTVVEDETDFRWNGRDI